MDLGDLDGEEHVVDKSLPEVVGSLLGVANQTRPDIANAVRAVARFSRDPETVHWKAAQRFYTLCGPRHTWALHIVRRIVWTGTWSCVLDLGVHVDADYASKATYRGSVPGVPVICGGSPVACFSRTQTCVTLTTTEAEYIAMRYGVKEAIFVRGVLTFLVPDHKFERIKVFEDNEAAKRLEENPHSSSYSKHIIVRHPFLRELVAKGDIIVEYVPRSEQHADTLMKTFVREFFEKSRNFLVGIT